MLEKIQTDVFLKGGTIREGGPLNWKLGKEKKVEKGKAGGGEKLTRHTTKKWVRLPGLEKRRDQRKVEGGGQTSQKPGGPNGNQKKGKQSFGAGKSNTEENRVGDNLKKIGEGGEEMAKKP